MNKYYGLGVMTGTSLDGIDLVFCHFIEDQNKWSFEIKAARTVEMEQVWHDRLYCLPDQNAEIFAKTNIYFGHYLGQAIRDFIEDEKINPQFVASHGQTIFHQPDKNITVQIGDGETIVSYLTCPLVTNFRNKDVASGGEGAPLVPFGERHLWPDLNLFLNLGGFANLSFKDLAFDISGCNLVLNHLANQKDEFLIYDHDGQISASGDFSGRLFQQLGNLEYYSVPPPKSLGKEWLDKEIFPLLNESGISIEDQMHTYTRHIAAEVKRGCEKIKAQGQTMLVTGGGAHNAFLMDCLKNALEPLEITFSEVPDERIINLKEAIVFAFLGLTTLLGKPNILASVTGAERDICGGSIHLPPRGWGAPLVRPH